MEIAKALILAGRSRQDRGGPADLRGSAHLFPIANRPALFHTLDTLHRAGVLEVAILTEGGSDEPIRRAVGDGGGWEVNTRFIDWEPTSGLAGALSASEHFLCGEPVLVQHGSALLSERMHAHISTFARERLDALALRLPGPIDPCVGAGTPGYLLSPHAIVILAGSTAGQNPLSAVRGHGGRVRAQNVDGCVLSVGRVETLLDANRRALECLTPDSSPACFEDCTVQGPVRVDPTARLEHTLLRGPIIIGPGARLKDAYVGPYTSIGADVTIEGAQIEHSIVLADAELRFVGTRLESSLIGRGARVVRGFQLPGAIRVSIGDGAEIVLR